MLSFFPRGVLDEILNLIESVSEGFPSYSFTPKTEWCIFPPTVALNAPAITGFINFSRSNLSFDWVDVLVFFRPRYLSLDWVGFLVSSDELKGHHHQFTITSYVYFEKAPCPIDVNN